MKVITNHHARQLLRWHDLTAVEQNGFEYVTGRSQEWVRFFRYKGEAHSVCEFFLIPENIPELQDWYAHKPCDVYSGVLFKYNDESSVIAGAYFN